MENKRLSPIRVLIAIFILVGISYFAFLQFKNFEANKITAETKPWFAPYVDVTSTPQYAFEQVQNSEEKKNVILSFIVSSKTDPCIPVWGGVYTMDDATKNLDLDRRIARLRQRGGNVAISFGGQLNDELSVNCKSEDDLAHAYQSVIDRYTINTIDLDIEGNDLTNIDAMKRRAVVFAKLQKTAKDSNKSLAVWLTLPVAPQGLTSDGTNAISEFLTTGVNLAGVNVMTMDYGSSKPENENMEKAAESALNETHRQLGILYKQINTNFNDASLWSKIGTTVMIGQNDIADEIFTIENAQNFNEFVISKGIARMSMWSANRDIECGENYVNITVVSDSCSGVKQEQFIYTNTLSLGFAGNINSNASAVVKEDRDVQKSPDNPAQSPYQIWTEVGTYLEGTKVVWHHNVYEAKWWTQGDLPDNPVLQSWQTPWQIIGPVLPGEKPLPQTTLPTGTYPEWSGSTIFEAGDRVLLNGVPYQAKWWTEGDSPAASSSSPDSSPWILLTQDQVNKIVK